MRGPYATRVSAETALEIYLTELCVNEPANNSAEMLPTYSAEELRSNVTYAKHLFEDRWK